MLNVECLVCRTQNVQRSTFNIQLENTGNTKEKPRQHKLAGNLFQTKTPNSTQN